MRASIKKTFCGQNHPLLVGSIRQPSPIEAIADIKNCECDGAQAFILHIQLLEEQYRSFDCFKQIASSTALPIMAINYPTESEADDEFLTAVQIQALSAGFSAVDIRANTFDYDSRSSLEGCKVAFASANPKEISMRPDVINKQKQTIEKFHKTGAQVLISAHVSVELSEEQAMSLALEMQSRGADIVKIITDCQTPYFKYCSNIKKPT